MTNIGKIIKYTAACILGKILVHLKWLLMICP